MCCLTQFAVFVTQTSLQTIAEVKRLYFYDHMEEIKIIAEKIGYNGKNRIYLPCNLSSTIATIKLLLSVFC